VTWADYLHNDRNEQEALNIARALIEDATQDTVLWLQADPSAVEREYVRAIQARLADLSRIVERRMERSDVLLDGLKWSETVAEVLSLVEKVKAVRGNIVGKGLARLADHLPRELPGHKPRPKAPEPIRPVNTALTTTRLEWNEIEIAFLSDERVEICSGGERKTCNYGELGFEDRRNGKPNRAWVMLREVASHGGSLPARSELGNKRAMAQKRIEEIREKLRSHFGIQGDPIPFNGQTYQASFKIRCAQSFDT
jgi:hypothetical protein